MTKLKNLLTALLSCLDPNKTNFRLVEFISPQRISFPKLASTTSIPCLSEGLGNVCDSGDTGPFVEFDGGGSTLGQLLGH